MVKAKMKKEKIRKSWEGAYLAERKMYYLQMYLSVFTSVCFCIITKITQ